MKNIVDLANSNIFTSPFVANCNDKNNLFQVNGERQIATASAASNGISNAK